MQAIISTAKGGIIMSPFAIQVLLTLLYTGAESTTMYALEGVLGYNNFTEREVAHHYRSILKPLQNSPIIEWATGLYIPTLYPLDSDFVKKAKTNFYTDVVPINFWNNVNAAKTIDKLVGRDAGHKVHDIIPAAQLSGSTSMVLVNYIYFKAEWKNKFSQSLTRKEKFYTSSGKIKPMKIMHQTVQNAEVYLFFSICFNIFLLFSSELFQIWKDS